MRHNLHEQLVWLGCCQSWGDAFGARLDPDSLKRKASLRPESDSPLTVVGDWEPLLRRAHDGRLWGEITVQSLPRVSACQRVARNGQTDAQNPRDHVSPPACQNAPEGCRGPFPSGGWQPGPQNPNPQISGGCQGTPQHLRGQVLPQAGQNYLAGGQGPEDQYGHLPPPAFQRGSSLMGCGQHPPQMRDHVPSFSCQQTLHDPDARAAIGQNVGHDNVVRSSVSASANPPSRWGAGVVQAMGSGGPDAQGMTAQTGAAQAQQSSNGSHGGLGQPSHLSAPQVAEPRGQLSCHALDAGASVERGQSVQHATTPPDNLQMAQQQSAKPCASAALEALKHWRYVRSQRTKLAAFRILSNKILEQIAQTLPQTEEQLLAIPGVGAGKVTGFGSEILEVCRRHGTQQNLTPQVVQPTQWLRSSSFEPCALLQGHQDTVGAERVEHPLKRQRTGSVGGSGVLESAHSAPVAHQAQHVPQPVPKPAPVQAPPEFIDKTMLTAEQRSVADRALRGENLFISGAAGTGKSFLLRYLIQELDKANGSGVAITAPTGLAAVNVGGQTLHSFAGVGVWQKEANANIKNPMRYMLSKVKGAKATSDRWKQTRVLVIDEVSMLDPVFFEQLDFIGREIREDRRRGFGGMQLLCCGDFLQLPPIADREEGIVEGTSSPYTFCFETPTWAKCGLQKGTVILKEQVRQSGDRAFAELLNHVRAGHCTQEVLDACLACSVGRKPPPQDNIVPTRLYCTNRDVDRENEMRLRNLPGEMMVFEATDTFSSRIDGPTGSTSTEKKRLKDLLGKKVAVELRLKVNAQVILLKKVHGKGLVNGSRGVVQQLHQNAATVRFDNGTIVKLDRDKFQQAGSMLTCNRLQLPLRLGWALTVHKSQGMTLSRAEVQLDDVFSYGQAYVALSRLTDMAGLWVGGRGLGQRQIRAHPNALAFYGFS